MDAAHLVSGLGPLTCPCSCLFHDFYFVKMTMLKANVVGSAFVGFYFQPLSQPLLLPSHQHQHLQFLPNNRSSGLLFIHGKENSGRRVIILIHLEKA